MIRRLMRRLGEWFWTHEAEENERGDGVEFDPDYLVDGHTIEREED